MVWFHVQFTIRMDRRPFTLQHTLTPGEGKFRACGSGGADNRTGGKSQGSTSLALPQIRIRCSYGFLPDSAARAFCRACTAVGFEFTASN